VVECGGLENRFGPFRSDEGSNPSPSASASICLQTGALGRTRGYARRRRPRATRPGQLPRSASVAQPADRTPIANLGLLTSNRASSELDVLAMSSRPRPEGIVVRHSSSCASSEGESCDCCPGYQAQVFSARDQRTIRKTFRTLSDARAWRAETHGALRVGTLRAPSKTSLATAAEDWLAGAQAEIIRTRSGTPYKPSALRAYEQALRTKVLPELGHLRLSSITRSAVQDLVDSLIASGRSPSTVRNAILPLRAIYRRALTRADVLVNPTLGLALPAQRGRRERIADPGEATTLLGALRPEDQAAWATALYAGLRRGEIRGLRANDVDFERGLVCVEQSWDDRVGPIEPKSRAGTRRVPMAKPLRFHLAAQRLRSRAGGDDLFFGDEKAVVLNTDALVRRARASWSRAGLSRIGLHECRHTYAALMIAAGVNAKALSVYMGHSSITVTLDRYGHLMPGHEGEAAAMLSRYLERHGS
jgi:integrase